MSDAELFERNLHPRVLFGPDDVPALREKSRKGIPARALAEILRRCERATGPASPQFVDPALVREGGKQGRAGLGEALHCLAFAHVLTGEERWASAGVALLRAAAADGGGVAVAGCLPLPYDLLHGAMDGADRRHVEDCIRAGLVDSFDDRLSSLCSYVWGLGTNVVMGDLCRYILGLAATFDAERNRAALEHADSLVRRAVHLGIDEGGAIGEGPSYGWGDADSLSTSAEILRRAGVSDLWAEEPRFAAMCRHWSYLILPGARGQNTIGDAWRLAADTPHWASLLHARRLGDPVLQWVWEQLAGRSANEEGRDAPERFSAQLGRVVLWEDDAAEAARPDGPEWPTARCSGEFGQIVMRSGWGDDDLYFSLLAAGRRQGCHIHQHVDAGHFCLFALGEAFSIDSGYGDKAGRYHSLLMPHGEEPRGAPANRWGNMFLGGRVAGFGRAEGVDYACVDVARQWDCITALRRAMLIAAPGADPYVVLLDYYNVANLPGNYLWLLNSEPGNRMEIGPAGDRAAVLGKRHRLETLWAYPRAEDYPERHMLEVAADEIDSFPLAHRTENVDYFHGRGKAPSPGGYGRWGAGLRPRLTATLWGHNAQLLSALVPRRGEQGAVQVERIAGQGQFGLVLGLGDVTDTIVASPLDGRLCLGGMHGEAALVVARRDGAGRLLWWGAAECYGLQIDEHGVHPRQGEAETTCAARMQVK